MCEGSVVPDPHSAPGLSFSGVDGLGLGFLPLPQAGVIPGQAQGTCGGCTGHRGTTEGWRVAVSAWATAPPPPHTPSGIRDKG